MPIQKWRKYYIPLNFLFLVILGWIFIRIKWIDILPLLRAASLSFILSAFILALVFLLVQGLAWKYLLFLQGIRFPLSKCLLAMLSGHYWGRVTPNHVGECLRLAYLLEREPVSVGFSLSAYAVEKIMLNLTILLFGGGGMVALLFLLTSSPFSAWQVAGIAVFSAALLGVFIFLIFHRPIHEKLFRSLAKLKLFSALQERMMENVDDFHRGLRRLKSGYIAFPMLIYLGNELLGYLRGYALIHALGGKLSYFTLSPCLAMVTLAGRLIPISLFGLGTESATLMYLLKLLGTDSGLGLHYALLFTFIQDVILPCIGAAFWFAAPARLK